MSTKISRILSTVDRGVGQPQTTATHSDNGSELDHWRAPITIKIPFGMTQLSISLLAILLLVSGCVVVRPSPSFPMPTVTQHRDDLVVMKVPSKYYEMNGGGRVSISRMFYRHYRDEFDMLFIVSNVNQVDWFDDELEYHGSSMVVRNSIKGIGKPTFNAGWHFGSKSKLKNILHLTNPYLIMEVALHEIMHTWVGPETMTAIGIPTSQPEGHWGYSSVNGQLGGFNRENLVHWRKIEGKSGYTAGAFQPHRALGSFTPYCSLELYLAGLIPAHQLEDILVAEDVSFFGDSDGPYTDSAGNRIFFPSRLSWITRDQIVERLGTRIPSYEDSQKLFRIAVIAVESVSHPLTEEDIQLISEQISVLTSHIRFRIQESSGSIRPWYTFWDITGGRASLQSGNLQSFRKSK